MNAFPSSLAFTVLAILACSGFPAQEDEGPTSSSLATDKEMPPDEASPAVVNGDPRSAFIAMCEGMDFSESPKEYLPEGGYRWRGKYGTLHLVSPLKPMGDYSCEQHYDAIVSVEKLLIREPVETLEPLQFFSHFKHVSISHSKIKSLEPIAGNLGVERITIVNDTMPAESFLVIKKFTQLRNVWIQDTNFEDISILHDLPNLKKVELRYNRIRDLSPLNHMEDTFFIDVSYNEELDKSLFCSGDIKHRVVQEACDDPHDVFIWNRENEVQ